MLQVIFGSLGAALVTALVAVALDRRSKSGKIETSEAKDLWDSMRTELARLQLDNGALRAEQTVSRNEIAAVRTETAEVRQQMSNLGVSQAETRAQLTACTMEIARLSKLLAARAKPRKAVS